MKTIHKSALSFFLLALVVLSSCNKTEETTPAPTNNNTGGVSITLSNGYGVMAAVTSVSYTTVAGITVPVTTNTATAVFLASSGSSSYVDAGAVTLNGKALTKQSNNTYVYQNLTNPLTFPPVTWSVAGSASVPSINFTEDKPMPIFSGYETLPASITKASGVTISLGSAVSNADSIYVIISGGNNSYVLKRLGGNASQAVFSASDLTSLGATTVGMIQVAPWNYKVEDFNDLPYYFVNETVYSKIGVAVN
jgi:hypothetical protein